MCYYSGEERDKPLPFDKFSRRSKRGKRPSTTPVDLGADAHGLRSEPRITGSLLTYIEGDVTVCKVAATEVVSPAEIVNRAPEPIRASLDPPAPTENDVVFCRVETDLLLDDPDYDIVRYEYTWRVNDDVVRTVTSAAHSDAIPHHILEVGDVVECTVTPTDIYNRGETVSTLCSDTDPNCIAARVEAGEKAWGDH